MNDCLAVIPARGGSVGIPRKNLVPIGGRPLVAWTVAAALAAHRVDRVVVSTDDDDIAAAARDAGAEVPFRRSPELADGTIHSVHVVLDALRQLGDTDGYQPATVAMLLPTSPLRTAEDVDAALALMEEQAAPAVVAVSALDRYLTNLRWLRGGRLEPLDRTEETNRQRQDAEPLYAVNGAIFAARREVLVRHRTFHVEGAVGYVMSAQRSIDINEPDDLVAVRQLLES